MEPLLEKLEIRLREWRPETATHVRRVLAETIDLADHDALDLGRSRAVEQEVLDLTARGSSHYFRNGWTRPEERALRGATTRRRSGVEGSDTPGISAENSFSAATDYYHGLLIDNPT
jgi:hypothetical protein